MMSKLVTAALCALACATAVLGGTSNPIVIGLDTTMSMQMMNASGTSGNLYAYSVTSSKISSFYEYRFQMQLAPLSYVANAQITVAAYWKIPGDNQALTWTAMTPSSYYQLTSDGVSSSGQFNMVVDPKQLYQGLQSYQVAPDSIQIGFLVSTQSANAAVANGVYSVVLSEVHCPQAQDADVPLGSAGTEITGTCPGTYSRCMVVANMQYHAHRYLLASARSTSGNLYSVRMHNAALLSFNDVSYFDGTAGPVTVRTCLSNSSCEIEQDMYYVELRTTASQTTSTGYGVTLSQQAGAFATAAASFVTVAAAATAAILATRSH